MGSWTICKNCSLPPWIFIELLNCYIEFVRNVAMYKFDIKGKLHENVEVPKSFLSHKFDVFKMFSN